MMDQEQMENLECLNYLGSLIKNGARRKFNDGIVIVKEALSKNSTLSTSKLDLYLPKKPKAS